MKVLMIIRWLHYSGAPKIFLWVAKALADKGNDVTVLTFSKGEPLELPKNIRFINHDMDNCGLIGKIWNIRKIIKDISPDVSISFLLDSNVYNMFACCGLKTKSVVCERNDPFKPHYYKLKFWKPFFRLADGAVFQLDKVKEFYSCIKSKTTVIPNPVFGNENIKIKSFLERQNVIVSVGRLDIFQKRQDLLIQAFAMFHKNHLDYSLHFYGDGPDEQRLKELVEKVNLRNSVSFCGVSSNPQEAIKEAKFFVLSSDFEGIPNSLIEAMTIGLPCIATDCRPGGVALLIQHRKNGMIVPAGDAKELAMALSELADNPVFTDQLGLEAKNIISVFSEDKIADMWNLYINSFK